MDQPRSLLRERSPASGIAELLTMDLDGALHKTVTSREAGEAALPSKSAPADWSAVLERVREAAEVVRDSYDRVRLQESRLQAIAQRAREELKQAEVRVQMAEAHAHAAERRVQELEARLRAAEARAQKAEARAQDAEEWLTRIHTTIMEEFSEAGLAPPDTAT